MTYQKHVSLMAKDVADWLEANATGRENAKSINLLVSRFRVPRREIEQATEELREAGVPLCSAVSFPMGLYIARSYAEMKPWVDQMDHRLQTMAVHKHQAASVLRKLAEAEGIQTELFA